MMETSKSGNNIVVIGSCSIDFTTYAQRLPIPGETIHGTKFTTSFGGKGGNQCVAAAKLGGCTHMICRLGDDQWGNQYKQSLQEVGVNVTHVHITPDTFTGVAQITVAENGENQIVIVPGANSSLTTKDVNDADVIIKDAKVLIGQLETPLETTFEAFKLCKGIKLLNAAPALLDISLILPYCTILCVNETEAALLTKMEVKNLNVLKALYDLIRMGCEMVVITLGEKGAVYLSKEDMKATHVACEHVTPVDTTGAGDAFVGALATFLVSHKEYPIHQIIGAACQVATLSVTKEGTQTSYPIHFDALSNNYEFTYISE